MSSPRVSPPRTSGPRRRTSAFTSPPRCPRPLGRSPAVSAWKSGGNMARIDVFVLGDNGQIYHRTTTPGAAWQFVGAPLTGTLRGAPAAVAWNYGRIDLFAVDTGGT